MQKQIKKNQSRQQQKQLAVIMALVNGLNAAAPVALTVAADVAPIKRSESGRELASLSRGVRVLDQLFFSTAYAYTPDVSSGDVTGETVDGYQSVHGTGHAISATINDGGLQVVQYGGKATSATINNGGEQAVVISGTTSGTIVSGGTQSLFGGTANGTVLQAGELNINDTSGGVAIDAIVNGGTMTVGAAGEARGTQINGGEQHVNGTANSTTINSGTMNVSSGGTASATTINDGGYMRVTGDVITDPDNPVYGRATNTTVSGGTLDLRSGGLMFDTVVSGGTMYVDGGTASGTVVSVGTMHVNGGTASATTISDYGRMYVNSGTASGTQVSGGSMDVRGGTVTGTQVSGGSMAVSGGTVTGTQVSGGSMAVSGGAVTDVTLAGRQGDKVYTYGNMFISNGATVEDITVNDGGGVYAANGIARTVTINSGGMAQVNNSNGNINGATVSADGILSLWSSGSAENISLNDGYILQADTSAKLVVLPTPGTGDTPSIINGEASNLVLNNGGSLTVLNGHSASGTTVNSGGRLLISSGGSADDTAVNGGSVLLEDQALLGGVTLNQGTIGLADGANSAGITELAVSSGGTVDLTYSTDWGWQYPNTAGRSLTIGSLNGDAHFVINTDLANDVADHITISSGVGSHTVAVNYDPSFENDTATTVRGEAQFASAPAGTSFTAVSEAGGYRYLPTLSVNSDGTVWSVTGFTSGGASQAAFSAAGAAAGAVSLWRQENNSLTRRLGDLRNGGASGDWARVYKGEFETDSFGRRVKQQYTAIQGGHDTTVSYKGRDWHVGYTLGYLNSSASMERGSGDASSLSLGAYAAWLGDKGHYLDFIVKAGRLKNDYYSYDAGNQKISGDYHTWGTSLSAEYGYRKQLPGSWYLEPQAELTIGRVGSANYRLSDGSARVHQDSINSVVGRLGLAVGRTVGATHVYAKTSLLREFNATARTSVGGQIMREEYKDNWLEVALGLTGAVNDNVNGYLELSRTTGGDKAKTPWQVNLGARWNF